MSGPGSAQINGDVGHSEQPATAPRCERGDQEAPAAPKSQTNRVFPTLLQSSGADSTSSASGESLRRNVLV